MKDINEKGSDIGMPAPRGATSHLDKPEVQMCTLSEFFCEGGGPDASAGASTRLRHSLKWRSCDACTVDEAAMDGHTATDIHGNTVFHYDAKAEAKLR